MYAVGVTEETTDLTGDRELARMMIEITERGRCDLGRAVAPFGLPVPLARAVLVLAEPLPMRRLAAELGYDPSHVTSLADQLERRGLAERAPGADRRVKILRLTPAGQELHEQLTAAVAGGTGLTRRLDDAQRRQLRSLLELLLEDDGS